MIGPLFIKSFQIIRYSKYFDSNETMFFRVINNKLLKKYTKIWEKVNNLMNIKFDSGPIYGDNDKYIESKIKLYGDKVNTDFQGKKIPKENTSYKRLSLIMLDSAIRGNVKYYPQTLLEKMNIKQKRTKWRILLFFYFWL